MKHIDILLLASVVGIGLLTIDCGGSGDTQQDESTSAESNEPAADPGASPEAPAASASDAKPADDGKPPSRARRASMPPPVRGVGRVQILTPATKVDGNDVVSTVRVRNVSEGTLTRFTVTEFWYDQEGTATRGGSRTHQKPMLPGEVVEFELRTTKNPKFFQNQFEFSHANGEVRATVVDSMPEPGE